MPIESANFIADLNPTNPASPDLVSTSDDHLRLIKQSLKNTFPNLDGAVTATPPQLMGFVPIGGIIMWSGAYNAVPSGWALCDGTTNIPRSDGAGTINAPNLIDKFIKGSAAAGADHLTSGGSLAKAGTTGASGAHAHTGSANSAGGHSHSGVTTYTALSIAQMPYHAHVYQGTVVRANYGGGPDTSAAAPSAMTTSYEGGGAGHAHGIYYDGDHVHSLSINSVADHTHTVSIEDSRPPYFALAFIMKT